MLQGRVVWSGPDKSAPSCLWIVYLGIGPDATLDRQTERERECGAEHDGGESRTSSENSC
jgi:hypothetical protein